MLSVQIVRGMIEYHYALQRRLWDSIMTLNDEQFTTDFAYSNGSIRNHLANVTNTDASWVGDLQGDPNAEEKDPSEFTSRASLRAYSEQIAANVMAYVATLDEQRSNISRRGCR